MGDHLKFSGTEQDTDEGHTPGLGPGLLQAVRQLRDGVLVEESFRVISAELSSRLFGYFRKRNFSSEDAEDLVQKTLTRVYTGIKGLNRDESFFGWLFAIARNLHLTAIEEQQRENRLLAGGIELADGLADWGASGWSPEKHEQEQLVAKLLQAVERLPVQQRQCLLLRVRDEMSYGDIAETLRLSVNTVRNHLAEAKKSLQRQFKREPKR